MPSNKQYYDQFPVGAEPRLSDVLSDPVIQVMMARDGVSEAERRSVIHCAQRSLRARTQG